MKKVDFSRPKLRGNCGECRWFDEDARLGEGVGACRRFPPTIQFMKMVQQNPLTGQRQEAVQPLSNYPITDRKGWCGEFVTDFTLADASPLG